MRIAINGMGRIGRLAFRQLLSRSDLAIVAVNDRMDARTLAHLLTYDSVHGRATVPIACEGEELVVAGRRIPVLQQPEPATLPHRDLAVDLVLECSGRFQIAQAASAHLQAGAGRVVLADGAPDADLTLLPGLAWPPLGDHLRVISAGCADTHALLPLVQVLDGSFGLEHGLVTVVHSYTSEQKILDLPHENLRLARAAPTSMIPSPTVAAEELARLLPHLAGRLQAMTVRVPTPDVSLVELTALLRRDATLETIASAFRDAASGPLTGLLTVNTAELVSVDLTGRPEACAFDPFLTKILRPRFVKVFAWFDNEWAYAARLVELATWMARV